MTKTAQGHMTLDSAQDDTNSGDSSMNTMLFKFLLETLDELEDKYHEQSDKIEGLETTLGELGGNLVSSEKLVIEQNKKISELKTKQNEERNKIVALEMNIADKDSEILELKGNLEVNKQLIKDQNDQLEQSNRSWQKKV